MAVIDTERVHAPISVTVPRGPVALDELLADSPDAFALIVVEGLLMRELLLAQVSAAELGGEGDVLALRRPPEELVPSSMRFMAIVPSRVTLLDPPLERRLQENPALAVRLFGRAVRQGERKALHRAALHLPHVEQRVLAVFWLLAERWGRVGPAGVVVPLTLTHQTIGALVGARRPTVSLALKTLAERGDLTRREDGSWLLRQGSAERVFGTVSPPPPAPLPELAPGAAEVIAAPAEDRSRTLQLQEDFAFLRRRLALQEEHRVSTEAAAAVLERCRQTRSSVMLSRARREAPGPARTP